jgi:hypothetical protein
MASYEWRKTQTGRKYVRTAGKAAGKVALTPPPAPVEAAPEAVAEAEYVPEVKIEDPQQKRGPGRPKKVAPVTIEDDDDE